MYEQSMGTTMLPHFSGLWIVISPVWRMHHKYGAKSYYNILFISFREKKRAIVMFNVHIYNIIYKDSSRSSVRI